MMTITERGVKMADLLRKALASLKAVTPNALIIGALASATIGSFVLAPWLGFYTLAAGLGFLGWVLSE